MIEKSKNKVDLAILAESIKRDVFNNLNCIQIGVVDSFNHVNQTAVVQIAMKRLLPNGVIEEYTPLVDCPVFCLSGAVGGIDIPINKGDTCIILFNDRRIDEWWTTNQNQVPAIFRTHDFSDALVLVGIRSLQNLILGYLYNAVRLWYNESSIVLSDASCEVTAPQINMNCSEANFNAILANFNGGLVNLGIGGNQIARVGDEVTITIPTGSSAGTYTGTITSGGVNTSI